jgi:bacillolysin
MRTLSLLLLTAGLAGCTTVDPSPAPPGGDEQERALADLEQETGTPWIVRYHPDLHTPAFLEGRTAPLVAHASEAPGAARSFFRAHRALFKMVDPDGELDLDRADGDELGMAHARFRQQQGGVPVRGGEVTAHFTPDGALTRVHGRFIPIPAIDLIPIASAAAAKSAAQGAVAAAHPKVAPEGIVAGRPSLAIDPGVPKSAPRLVWVIDVPIDDPYAPGRVEVLVDAVSGLAYRQADQLDTVAGSGIGVFGDQQPLDVAERNGRYYLEDARAGSPPQKVYGAAGGGRLPGSEVSSARADRSDDSGPFRGAAVDAAAYASATSDYYARVHGRKGALGDGAGVRATVHYGYAFNNAFWNGRQLVFGDGDGATFAPLSGALDVVAHEFTHAVTQASAGLGRAGEPGALNEAVSDIFACFIEHDLRGAGANWRIGEDVYFPGQNAALRDLANPHRTRQPMHTGEEVETDQDNGGVHVNASIPGHAAWLMTVGGVHALSGVPVAAIGRAAAQRIWYRALTRYLGPHSDFRDAADATVAAAQDLYGAKSGKTASVRDAWRAVGVLP